MMAGLGKNSGVSGCFFRPAREGMCPSVDAFYSFLAGGRFAELEYTAAENEKTPVDEERNCMLCTNYGGKYVAKTQFLLTEEKDD